MGYKRPNRDVSARRRRMQQKRKIPWGYVLPVIIILAVILGAIYYETTLPAAAAGWIRPPAGNGNFPIALLGSESLFLHIHPWLTITINGVNVTIPPGIGIVNPAEGGTYNGAPIYGGGAGSEFEPVHTHDNTGIIHIESPTNTNYTLGQFFQIWAATYAYVNFSGSNRPIVFNNTDILGFVVNSSSSSLKLLVNGLPAPAADYVGGSSSNMDNLVLNVLAYCNKGNSAGPPCSVTAPGDPTWNGGNSPYPYFTGQAIDVEYTS
ncbi:MAG TPA: hypothetical protein VJN71_04320 [Nitrososphaerales archaeon]|nr:hypothetical protein [Nitrososphaerales archaeon]